MKTNQDAICTIHGRNGCFHKFQSKTNQDKLRDAIEEIVNRRFTPGGVMMLSELTLELLSLFENSYKEREKELLAEFDKIIGKRESILKCEPEENKVFWKGYNKAVKEQRQKLQASQSLSGAEGLEKE